MSTATVHPVPPRDAGSVAFDAALCLLAGLAVGLSFCFSPETLPQLPLCPFHAATGLPCPGCGLTRAFCAISHGEFVRAWEFNPFGFVFYAGCLALPLWPVLRRRRPDLEARITGSRWFGRAPLLLIAALCLFGAYRIGAVLLGMAAVAK